MAARKYNLVFEIYDYSKSLSDLKTSIKRPLKKYVTRCSIQIDQVSKRWHRFHVSGALDDVDACHMLFNNYCLSDMHVVRALDEAGDNIRTRAYSILSRMEQQFRAFINRVMSDVAGKDWWQSWCPTGVDEKAKIRQHDGGNDHQIELVDFTDLLTLMTAKIQDWPDDYQVPAREWAEILGGVQDFDAFKKQVERRLTSRSAWDDIFPPYIVDTSAWDALKNDLEAIIIPTRHLVMHHRPIHLYHLDKIKKYSRSLRKHLDQSRHTIEEKRRKELQELNREMTQTLQKSVSRINRSLFGTADWARFIAQQQEAFRKTIAPIVEVQKQWERKMRPWLEMQEQLRKQMEPFRKIQEQWRKDIEKLTRGLR